jgi:hypothetical protein
MDEGASNDEGREVGALEEAVCFCLVAQHLLIQRIICQLNQNTLYLRWQ